MSCPKSQSVQSLDALVCGYAPRWRAEKTFAFMYQAFSDDSMSGEGNKTLLLAACVQRYKVWAEFCFDWEAALAISPSINYFKMREARMHIKQFEGWSTPEVNAKIRLLARVIAAHRPKIIVAWISRTVFEETVGPIIPYTLRHPYIMLFYSLILKLAEWQHQNRVTLPTDFVFDEQGPVGEEAVIWYRYMKHIQEPHIAALMGSTPIFRDDKRFLPLQAADLVAFHMRRRKDYPNEDESSYPTFAIKDLPYADTHLNKEVLALLATQMKEIPHVTEVHAKPKGYKPGMVPGWPPRDIE